MLGGLGSSNRGPGHFQTRFILNVFRAYLLCSKRVWPCSHVSAQLPILGFFFLDQSEGGLLLVNSARVGAENICCFTEQV